MEPLNVHTVTSHACGFLFHSLTLSLPLRRRLVGQNPPPFVDRLRSRFASFPVHGRPTAPLRLGFVVPFPLFKLWSLAHTIPVRVFVDREIRACLVM